MNTRINPTFEHGDVPAKGAAPTTFATLQRLPGETALLQNVPLWKVEGVTDDNVALVRESGIYVHYPKLGHDGWYIGGNYQFVVDLLADRAPAGLTAKAVTALPRNTSLEKGLLVITILALIGVALITEIAQIIILTSLFLGVLIGINHTKTQKKIGALLKPLIKPAKIIKPCPSLYDANEPFSPGTLAWYARRDRD